MTRISQIMLARTSLMLRLAHTGWIADQNRTTTVTLLQRTTDLCRELAMTLHQFAVHNQSPDLSRFESLVDSASLLAIVANTSCDPGAVLLFKRYHKLGLPGSFHPGTWSLTPATLGVNLTQDIELLESYCDRAELDQTRTIGLLHDFAYVAQELAHAVYKLTPTDDPGILYIAELAIMALNFLRACDSV